MPLNLPRLLTTVEAAKLLRVSPNTLAVWRATKRYPIRYLKIGRYDLKDIEEFLKRGERT